MGTWGMGPFDNDSAADLAAKFADVVDRGLRGNNGRRDRYPEARTAAHILLATHGTDILGGPSLEPVLRLLCRMRADVEWLSQWKSPRKIAAVLDTEIDTVIARITACKGCRRSMTMQQRTELGAVVSAAKTVKVPLRRVKTAKHHVRVTKK